ncbi:hypothetical protein [Candidatus Rhodobacter oscarellae]|nr:hypothetical protein [Candidatus Rhodobacter lobularis]
MIRKAIIIWTFVAAAAAAHEDLDGIARSHADEIFVPTNIQLLSFIRFTRAEHKLVLDRMLRDGAAHFVGTMSRPLTVQAFLAGRVSPRVTSKFVWEMAQLPDWDSRAARLTEQAAILREAQARLGDTIETLQAEGTDAAARDVQAAEEDLAAVGALLALVELWQTNPMDGAGS